MHVALHRVLDGEWYCEPCRANYPALVDRQGKEPDHENQPNALFRERRRMMAAEEKFGQCPNGRNPGWKKACTDPRQPGQAVVQPQPPVPALNQIQEPVVPTADHALSAAAAPCVPATVPAAATPILAPAQT